MTLVLFLLKGIWNKVFCLSVCLFVWQKIKEKNDIINQHKPFVFWVIAFGSTYPIDAKKPKQN